MSNVLPQDGQKKIWTMYRSRFVLVTSIMLLALAAFAAAALIPTAVAVISTESAAEMSQDDAIENEAALAIDYAQALIQELGPRLSATSSPLETVIFALQARPGGVRVNRINYVAGEEEYRITFLGSAVREDVSAYRDALTRSGRFSGVAVPVGALVGANDGNFSIVMTGQF